MIQKIFATPWVIAISVRAPGKTYWIYQGRGQGWEGVWLQDGPPPSSWRVVDHLIEFYRKRLSAALLVDIRLDPLDRLLHLDYHKWGVTNTLSYYWQGRLAYMGCCYWDSGKQAFKIFLSWDQHGEVCKTTYDHHDHAKQVYSEAFSQLGIANMGADRPAALLPQTDIWDVLVKSHVHEHPESFVSKENKTKNRKLLLFQKDLERVEQIHLIKQFLATGEPLTDKHKIGDHIFKFKSDQSEYQRRDIIFQKIKRLQIAAKIIQEKMRELTDKKSPAKSLVEVKSVFPVARLKDELLAISQKPMAIHGGEGREYKIFEGKNYSLGVGLSARGNDLLRKEWAKKEDIWFHAASGTSPHVILKWKKSGILTAEIIQVAGSCLLQQQKLSSPSSEVDLIFTKVGQLKGVKGSPGSVTVKGEKHLKIIFKGDWEIFL